MSRLSACVLAGCFAMVQFAFADPGSQPPAIVPPPTTLKQVHGVLPPLPPPPEGKSTVIGGAIRNVDPVRDEFVLQVFGGKAMRILFDERTKFYRNGVRTSLRNLGSDNHASVETVLDGTAIFALSIHTLSKVPEGESQGQVVRYKPDSRELTISAGLTQEPIQLRLTPETTIERVGQAASNSPKSGVSDLIPGTLVSVQFTSGNNGRGIARKISIIAIPGTSFVFTGKIISLDMPAHVLSLIDSGNGSNYQISFHPSLVPDGRQLHVGTSIRVTAKFESSRYTATKLTIQ